MITENREEQGTKQILDVLNGIKLSYVSFI